MKKSPLAVAMKKRIGGNDEIQKVEQWLDTGFPPLNEAVSGDLEGGLPCGRIGVLWRFLDLRLQAKLSSQPAR
ncbi:hypothetical protein [Klebsiella pneumoniae]|uniref:hypothetical protein n=1 Tax=Klebsiella pneumoniae TaxID=573 RepID=UPI003EE14E9A